MRRLGLALAAAARSGPGPDAPVFWSLADSTASLVDALVEALTARGVDLPHRHPDRCRGSPAGWARGPGTLGG